MIGQAAAGAAATDLYVNNNSGSHCSNTGSGTQSAPYCTVQAAANVALPGQTVHVALGDYPGQLKLTRSGTAEQPITFVGVKNDSGETSVGVLDSDQPGNGLLVSGAQHIRIKDIGFRSGPDEPILFDHATDVTVLGGTTLGGNAGVATVRVGTGSSKVTIANTQMNPNGPGVVVEQGATDTVVSTNDILTYSTARYSGIVALGSPGTVVVGNSITNNCGSGIVLAAGTTGAVVENNVIDTGSNDDYPTGPCPAGSPDTGITASAQAAADAKADYNVVSPTSGGPAYDWADTQYTGQAAFTAATGQGAHDFVSDPTIPWTGTAPRTAAWVDSADENAPGMVDTDAWGFRAQDDPLVPNTGTGSGFRDRGAMEYQSFGDVFTPTGPTRILDTRTGTGTSNGTVAPIQTGTGFDLNLAGVAGVPATGVGAVTLNVTATGGTSSGVLTVYQHGQPVPVSSSLNWAAGQTVANLVTVPVVDGKVSFYVHGAAGKADIIADLAGYYSAHGSPFNTAGPARLMDTRNGTGVARAPVATGHTVDLQVAGVHGIPATGVTAVTLNVTAADTTSTGVLTVYPHGGSAPNVSNLNWTAGSVVANAVTVPVGADGKISFYVHGATGKADIIADVAGYYGADGKTSFSAEGPYRFMDTRKDTYLNEGMTLRKAAPVPAGGTLVLPLNVPDARSVVLNVTVTAPATSGFLTVYPTGTAVPTASSLNWVKGQTVANQVTVPVGTDGKVSFYNHSGGNVQIVVDYFGRMYL